MKFLLAICISMFATAAIACTDFSGRYRDEEMEVYTIEQSGCSSVTYIEDDGERSTFLVDGQYRLSDEDDEVKVYTAANFVGATIVFDSKMEYKQPFPDDVPEETIPRTSKIIYSKDSYGNLISMIYVYNSAGAVIGRATTTHPKV